MRGGGGGGAGNTGAKSMAWFGVALIVGGLGRKSYLVPAEIASFSNRDLSRRNKHDSFWHVVSTGYFYEPYFYEPLFFQIFFPWKFIKI